MSSKFLGKSLAQLNEEMGATPDISVLTGTERVVVKPIPLVQISPNPNQPRKTFNENELNDLTKSVREKGVLSPIILRTVKDKPYLYEIVAGERRYRAAQRAGLSKIPAVVKTLSDKDSAEIALIENVQRENLNPIEEAEGYKDLMEKYQNSLEDVSKLIGKSVSYIRNLMRINSLPESVKELIKEGKTKEERFDTLSDICKYQLDILNNAERIKLLNERSSD